MTLPSVKRAFLIHFGLSLLVFLALALIMMKIWFPGDLFMMDGGWQVLKIIAPIDLVLGPALTLCFYRTWKKSLKFDMSAIAAVQIAALSYGVFAAYQQRPVAIVFAENRFETLSHSEYKKATVQLVENDLQPKSVAEFGDRSPRLIYAQNFSGAAFGQYLADVMNGLPELRERSDRYESVKLAKQEIAQYRVGVLQNVTTVEIAASSDAKTIAPAEPAHIYPLKARFDTGTIELDPETMDWIKITRSIEQPSDSAPG